MGYSPQGHRVRHDLGTSTFTLDSSGSTAGLLLRIRVSAGSALLSAGLRWSPGELIWFL